MESSKYIFPVGIDMGAKYTGVFMLSHLDGVLPTAADATAMTIELRCGTESDQKRDLFWLVDCLILLLTIS